MVQRPKILHLERNESAVKSQGWFKIIKILEGSHDKDTIIFEVYHDFGGGDLYFALKFKQVEYEVKDKDFDKFIGEGPIYVCENNIYEIDLQGPGGLKFKKLEK